MTYARRIVLHSPPAEPSRLEAFVEACIADGVELIAIGGDGARELEDEIDWIIIGDGSQHDRFIVTTAHSTIEEAREYAEVWGSGTSQEEIRL
jgi:hypothetical protein